MTRAGPRTVRAIEYLGNAGGGVRVTAELITALGRAHPDVRFEFVSHGAALDRYRALLEGRLPNCTLLDVAPTNVRATRAVELTRLRGGRRVARALGVEPSWHFAVSADAVGDADLVWMPWLHRHRLPAGATGARVVGTFHDAIFLTAPMGRHFHAEYVPEERATTEWWLDSAATIVTGSHANAEAARALFGTPHDRFFFAPYSSDHQNLGPAPDEAALPPGWAWAERPFLISPGNVSHHKNHETLLRGVAAWGARHPLVLTGAGTGFAGARGVRGLAERAGLVPESRSTVLGRLATQLGFAPGASLHPLGYLPNPIYYALLRRAWAMVMPTLAEGYGFPIEEAVRLGVPVVSSNIPVLREHMARLGAEVIWFDPSRPDELAERLAELAARYDEVKRRAAAQIPHLTRRSWSDVAADYWTAFLASYEDNRAHRAGRRAGRAIVDA